ncbi:glutamate receptor ionotropic, delta-2-like [Palaemon carinicauda]|uniref:glutamate receptor ionotropic, delta-2-like n=1 Tax=Palaemon carinicauda TaxID=392227 RepID=UPI0035B5FF69
MTTAVSLILVFCSGIMVRTSAATSGMESSAALMERIPEASIFMDQRGIERSLTPPAMSQLRKSFTSDSVPESGTLVIPDTMSQILSLLISKSPPHQLYLLYDSNYRGLDDVLEFYSNSWMECTVIEYTPDLEYFVDVISTPLIGTNTGRRHILVICSRENVMEIFKTVSSLNLESVWNWWIIFVMEEETANLLRNIIREGSIVLLVVINPGENTFKLFSSHIEQNGDISFLERETWKLLSTESGEIFPQLNDLYSDFGGRRLTVTANNDSPFFVIKEFDNGTYFADSGIDVNIVDALGDTLNFTYKVMKPADGKWGGPLPDGTITGMIGEVARRNAHIAICEITVTGVREGVIDFTMPYYLEALTIISSTPAEKNRAFAVFSPFGYKVWICIALSTLIIGPLLTLESLFMKKYLKRDDVDTNLENFSFNMFRSLVVQTNRVPARYWPHRFTFVFWYLFCLNILVIYSGTLTAVLVTPAFEKPIDDLTDLPQAISNGFTLGIVGETSFEYLFKEAKQGIYKETWNLFNHKDRSKSFFSGPDEPFDKVKS